MSENNKKAAVIVCGCIAVIGTALAVWLTVDFYRQEREAEDRVEELRQIRELAIENAAEALKVKDSEENQTENKEDEAEGKPAIANPYVDIFSQNEDMAAWIVVDDTVIDYPVMQTMEDENYYLKRDFYGNEDPAGCLLLDTDSDLGRTGTANLIIHGHNMKAGTMFGSLDEYENESYYQEHKYMELYTQEDWRQYEVIAVFRSQVYYVTDLQFKYYNFFGADTQNQFDYFYENIKSLSLYDTGVEAELGDSFLTLSTCAYHVDDGRFVVVAKEVERGEYLKNP